MTGVPKEAEASQSRRVRRMTVVGFCVSFPLSFWMLGNYLYGDALPAGLGWYANVEPWLAFGFFVLWIFCFVKILRSSVGGIFKGPRDERQQAAFTRTYSLSYRIFSNFVMAPIVVFLVINFFTGYVPELTPQTWMGLLSTLVVVASLLPKMVAMWLEPDPLPEDPFRQVQDGGLVQ